MLLFLKFIVSILLIVLIIVLIQLYQTAVNHRKSAVYIQDKRNGKIHDRFCAQVNKIPEKHRKYYDEWEYRYLRDNETAQLNYCRLCINEHYMPKNLAS